MATIAQRNTGVAKRLLGSRFFKSSRETGLIYMYDERRGVYAGNAESYIGEETQRVLGDFVTNHSVSEVEGYIRRASYLQDGDSFDANPDLLVVGNGILNLETGQLIPHTPSYPAMRSVVVNYNPTADCPVTKRVLSQDLTDSDRGEFIKFLGYLLIPDNRYKRALVLVGPKNTGKTTVLDLIRGLLGDDNISNERIQRLCDSNFSEFELVGKMANLRDDIDPVTIENAEKIKELTGDFGVTKVEQKNIQRRTSFRNRSKLLFTANLLPLPRRPDAIYFSRWVVIEMRKKFSFGDFCQPEERADATLKVKLQSELSGVLNLALEGRRTLLKSNGFPEYSDEIATARYMAYAGDTAGRFLLDRVYKLSDGAIAKGDLYSMYTVYCGYLNEPSKSDEEFSKMLRAIHPTVADGWLGNRRAWRGISVRETGDIPFQTRWNYPVSIRPSDFSDEKEEVKAQ